MKKFIVVVVLVFGSLMSYAQEKSIDDIIITRNIEDTEGYQKGEELYATHHKLYASANKIRVKAIEKLKEEALAKGYDLVLITKDDFSHAPINNVSLVATGYKKNEEQNDGR